MDTANAATVAGQEQGFRGRGRLTQLVAELERQRESRVDFVADGRSFAVRHTEQGIRLAPADLQAEEWLPREGLPFLDSALPQLGGRVSPEVPTKFLRALASSRPAIAACLMQDLLRETAGRHLVRVLDGKVRAVLSNSYRVLDNYDLAFAALDVARKAGGEVVECCLSDTAMRIKFTSRQIRDSVAEMQDRGGGGSHEWLRLTGARVLPVDYLPDGPGTIHPVVTISNSETGHGGLHVRLGILRAMCCNMAIIESVASEIHLGGRLDPGLYTTETQAAEAKAVMLKCRDAIAGAFDPEKFRRLTAKARTAQADLIQAPEAVVAHVAESFTDDDRQAILRHFLVEYEPTRWGLSQAIARHSQDMADGDSAADLELLAGRVISDRAWAMHAEAV